MATKSPAVQEVKDKSIKSVVSLPPLSLEIFPNKLSVNDNI